MLMLAVLVDRAACSRLRRARGSADAMIGRARAAVRCRRRRARRRRRAGARRRVPAAAAADARATASSNDARLLSCACAGTDAAVVVEVDLPAFGLLGGTAKGRARAEVRPECVLDLPECG